jgi:hypothetical protein
MVLHPTTSTRRCCRGSGAEPALADSHLRRGRLLGACQRDCDHRVPRR